jgi:hypothetical protein
MNLLLNSLYLQLIIWVLFNNVEKLQQPKQVLQFFRHFPQIEGRQ